MQMKIRTGILTLAIAVASVGAARADLVLTLAPSSLNVLPGGSVQFTGTLTNTGSTSVFLNGDSITSSVYLSGNSSNLPVPSLTVDDKPFIFGAPLMLQPGGTYSGPFFIVTANAAMTFGSYFGTYSVQSGPDRKTFTTAPGSTALFTVVVNEITPYIALNGVWNATPESAVTVTSGTSVSLGPWPFDGTWSWFGLNGFTSTSREIDNIPLNPGVNTYVATYTDPNSVVSSETFTITVNEIVPYIAVNGVWNQTPENTVTVPLGSAVSLGPWPQSGGTWLWTGPNGFTSTAREIDDIPLSVGSNAFVAQYTDANGIVSTETFTVTASGCSTTNPITPYIAENGVWNSTPENSVTVTAGTNISLGPWPNSGGSWSWSGPNGFTSTAREIDSIALSEGANTFVATYTSPNACIYTQPFTITVQ